MSNLPDQLRHGNVESAARILGGVVAYLPVLDPESETVKPSHTAVPESSAVLRASQVQPARFPYLLGAALHEHVHGEARREHEAEGEREHTEPQESYRQGSDSTETEKPSHGPKSKKPRWKDIGGGEGAAARRRAAWLVADGVLREALDTSGLSMFSVRLSAPVGQDLRTIATVFSAVRPKGESALLVLDVSPAEYAHLHGLAIVEDIDEFILAWQAASGCDEGAVYTQRLTGSGGPWTTENRQLGRNLRKVLRYAFGRKDLLVPAYLIDRVLVASGVLGSTWSAVSEGMPRRSSEQQCLFCGRGMRKRRDTKWCSGACKQKAYLRRLRERREAII